MTPEEVMLEAIRAADQDGDSPGLRHDFCQKLADSLRNCEIFGVRWNAVRAQRDDGQHERR